MLFPCSVMVCRSGNAPSLSTSEKLHTELPWRYNTRNSTSSVRTWVRKKEMVGVDGAYNQKVWFYTKHNQACYSFERKCILSAKKRDCSLRRVNTFFCLCMYTGWMCVMSLKDRSSHESRFGSMNKADSVSRSPVVFDKRLLFRRRTRLLNFPSEFLQGMRTPLFGSSDRTSATHMHHHHHHCLLLI